MLLKAINVSGHRYNSGLVCVVYIFFMNKDVHQKQKASLGEIANKIHI